jgi:hypothetical protein
MISGWCRVYATVLNTQEAQRLGNVDSSGRNHDYPPSTLFSLRSVQYQFDLFYKLRLCYACYRYSYCYFFTVKHHGIDFS